MELLMVKHGVLDVYGCHFSSCDIDAVFDFVCLCNLFSVLRIRFYINK